MNDIEAINWMGTSVTLALAGAELILMDFNGQVLFRKTNSLKNTETIDLDISLYDKGIYFLRIVGKNLDETHKIIIE